ncbi:MAG TPA: thymidylate kinase [Candidatus Sulfotelmatobacter sp.]|nr:thymidylate kinase [Candidatus Sulfotelmatobacter sp.]
MRPQSVQIISFSGIDGAGKSTQIDALLSLLESQGQTSKLYTFWDDVVVLGPMRENLSFKVFKGDKGVGSPERPISRRDKNVSSWYAVAFRLFLYALDALRLTMIVSRAYDRGRHVVIFDRYIYDELANLPLQYWIVRIYVRALLKVVPKPVLAFLVDADPEEAYRRKPEYPLEFVRRNREAYLKMARLAKMTVLPPASVETTASRIAGLFASLDGRGDLKPAMSVAAPSESVRSTSG